MRPETYNILDRLWTPYRALEKPALIFEDESGEVQRFTFRELDCLSNRYASVLRALGVGWGDRVGLLLPSSPDIYVLYLACFKMAAVPVPISLLFGSEGIEYRVRQSNARVLITIPETEPNTREISGECRVVTDFRLMVSGASDRLETARTKADDNLILIYSSGTTGPPKGVVHTHQSLTHTYETIRAWTGLRSEDVHWNTADPTWLGGIMTDLFCAFGVGATVLKARRRGAFDPEDAFEKIVKHRVTNLFAPPTAYRMMRKLEKIRERYRLDHLRVLTSAGEPLNAEVVEWGQAELNRTILDGYGQTEGIMMATNLPSLPVKAGSMGKPAEGVTLALLDEMGHPVPPGEPGEIAIRRGTPMLFKYYWNNPEATAACFTGNWYRTGDMAACDTGGYLHFMGRADDVMITAGYRVGPFEVESCLLTHPAVQESAVVAWPDPEGLRGHVIKAYVVLKEGRRATEEEIQQHVRTRLSLAEYPRLIEFVSDLPKTRSGKIIRKELRARAPGG